MRIAKIKKKPPEIPTASVADVAFLLLIFFMVATVFRIEKGLFLAVPEAKATERILKRRNVSHIWLDRNHRISIEDNLLDLPKVRMVMEGKVRENPDLITVVRADQNVDYGAVNDLLETLKEAAALKITFATEFER